MAIKNLVEQYLNSSETAPIVAEKRMVSARISASDYDKLGRLAMRFGIKKSALAAELLMAAIDEALNETGLE